MNKVMLIGNVGCEPDIRYYDADQCVATVKLGTTERGYTLQNGTRVPDHTDWHTVLFWRDVAKVVEKYVHTGDKLYVEGRIRYRSEDDKQGRRRFFTEIWGTSMEMLTPKSQRLQTAAASPSAQGTLAKPTEASTPMQDNPQSLPF